MKWLLTRRRRLEAEEEARVVAAIAAAERGSRGEVRVHVEARCPGGDALARASVVFGELGMRSTKEDTGVLLYVAEEDRVAAVFAGGGIHGAREPSFWSDVVAAVVDGYRRGDRAEGLEQALGLVGEALRQAAPGHDVHGNELPNEVSYR